MNPKYKEVIMNKIAAGEMPAAAPAPMEMEAQEDSKARLVGIAVGKALSVINGSEDKMKELEAQNEQHAMAAEEVANQSMTSKLFPQKAAKAKPKAEAKPKAKASGKEKLMKKASMEIEGGRLGDVIREDALNNLSTIGGGIGGLTTGLTGGARRGIEGAGHGALVGSTLGGAAGAIAGASMFKRHPKASFIAGLLGGLGGLALGGSAGAISGGISGVGDAMGRGYRAAKSDISDAYEKKPSTDLVPVGNYA